MERMILGNKGKYKQGAFWEMKKKDKQGHFGK